MKRVASLVLLLLWVGVASAQLLWKISGHDLKHPSYLFATHTRVDASFLDKMPEVFKYFDQTKTVVSEFVSEDFDGLANIKEVAFLPAGKTLHNYLSEEDYSIISKTMYIDCNMDLDNLTYLQPQFVLTLYHEQMARKLSGNQTDLFLDAWFQWYGSENGYQVKGLENLSDYLSRLSGAQTLEKQTETLVKTFTDKANFLISFRQSIDDYKKGNLTALYQSAIKIDTKANEMKALNEIRVPKLQTLMSESPCFIALDAAYFAGENGLLEMLKNKGYKVTAIKK